MSQAPQFRPPGPPGPPPGPPGPPGPQGAVNLPGGRMSYPPQSVYPVPMERSSEGDGKRRKKKKRSRRDSSSSDDDECKCPPQQPATQIFITPPGMQPAQTQGQGGCVCCGASNCPETGGQMPAAPSQGFMDPAKLCQLQCYKGQSENTQTQVICCPPVCSRKQKRQQATQVCRPVCECGGESDRKTRKKPQYGTMEGMMPATQQFLMFLQAYGLAAALIRDRNKREDERKEKEAQDEKQAKRKATRKERDSCERGRSSSMKSDKKK